LREGIFDVLVGVNLLREGLDLPEVSLVAILDADKEGFLRNNRSLTQTIGRAARNVNGLAILYADKITNSMQLTIDQTDYRRAKQMEHNKLHGLEPRAIKKKLESALYRKNTATYAIEEVLSLKAAEEEATYLNKEQLEKKIRDARKSMEKSAKELDFMEAARLRDHIKMLQEKLTTV
jgi:excinuclease ABC subunit B